MFERERVGRLELGLGWVGIAPMGSDSGGLGAGYESQIF